MIVADKKPIEEIIEALGDSSKILIAGCNECVTVCEAGGRKEVGILASALRIHFGNQGREVTIDEVTLERQCDREYLEEIRNTADQYDVILSLACGAGVQFMAENYPSMPVQPGVNTCFIGVSEDRGVWTERCQACGQCVLGQTGGICPISRCSKRMLNGPCGGSSKGKCEINSDLDCGWQLIIELLTSLDCLDEFEKVVPIKDWSTERSGGPRKVVKEEAS
ncbi:MAG: methylenetetrahydrofolate reductase C-terminal domain-containing protein [Candidatus Adiutricales bacterium]